MQKYRFIVDDCNIPNVQVAVLSTFIDELRSIENAEVIRSSQLPDLNKWTDVPTESSCRLAVRIEALKPISNTITLLLPGYIIPGRNLSIEAINKAITTYSIAALSGPAVAELDMLIVNNNHPEITDFHQFTKEFPTYESISAYSKFSKGNLSEFCKNTGIKSALLLSNRPWYKSSAPTNSLWLEWVALAIEAKHLSLNSIYQDILNQKVRPSLLNQVKRYLDGKICNLTAEEIDSLFIYPELSLSTEQKKLLISSELQTRTVTYAKKRTKKKNLRHIIKRLSLKKISRRLFKYGLKIMYKTYRLTLRPIVHFFIRKNKKQGSQ